MNKSIFDQDNYLEKKLAGRVIQHYLLIITRVILRDIAKGGFVCHATTTQTDDATFQAVLYPETSLHSLSLERNVHRRIQAHITRQNVAQNAG